MLLSNVFLYLLYRMPHYCDLVIGFLQNITLLIIISTSTIYSFVSMLILLTCEASKIVSHRDMDLLLLL